MVRLAGRVGGARRPRALRDLAAGDARRQHLRSRPDGPERHPVGDRHGSGCSRERAARDADDRRPGRSPVTEGTTILQACPRRGDRDPDPVLRRHDHAEERLPRVHGRGRGLAGARAVVLAPGRARHGRAHRHRAHPPQPSAGARAARVVGRPVADARDVDERWNDRSTAPTTASRPSTRRRRRDVDQPVKVDNPLYVRDYAKCILCYQCVDACGEQWQQTWAIGVAGRGFDARISTEYDVAAPRLGLRLLRQLHPGVPDRCADVHVRARHARGRHLGRGPPDPDRHDLSVLRCRVHADAARAGQRDRQGHAHRPTTTSPTATCASRAASASNTSRTSRTPSTEGPSGVGADELEDGGGIGSVGRAGWCPWGRRGGRRRGTARRRNPRSR